MTAPDLRILVHQQKRDEGLSLSLQLEARDPALKLHFATFELMPLQRLTEELIRDLFDGIAKLSLIGDADELRLESTRDRAGRVVRGMRSCRAAARGGALRGGGVVRRSYVGAALDPGLLSVNPTG